MIRKVIKSYKEENSPTDKLNKSFNKHDSNYVKLMKQSWKPLGIDIKNDEQKISHLYLTPFYTF